MFQNSSFEVLGSRWKGGAQGRTRHVAPWLAGQLGLSPARSFLNIAHPRHERREGFLGFTFCIILWLFIIYCLLLCSHCSDDRPGLPALAATDSEGEAGCISQGHGNANLCSGAFTATFILLLVMNSWTIMHDSNFLAFIWYFVRTRHSGHTMHVYRMAGLIFCHYYNILPFLQLLV